MEPKRRQTEGRVEREESRRRSLSPEYFVDLTVDSPLNDRVRTPVRRNVNRRSQNHQEPETSQIIDTDVIDCSNRLLPPKKRGRTDKGKSIAVVSLDDSTPTDDIARINDSVNGEANVLTCPICFEYLTSKCKPTSTRCGHVYCAECLQQTLTRSKKCPKCQATVRIKSCIRLYF